MTYEQWMRAVDRIVATKCGLNMDLLPDWLSRDAYEEGVTPEEAAEMCLEEAGYYDYVSDEDED